MTAASATLFAGLFDLSLAAFHVAFWRLFGWPQRLAALDPINHGILQVANLALIALFGLLGALLVIQPTGMPDTAAAQWLLAGLSVFWLARAAVQPSFFGLRHPASQALTGLFLVGAALHAWPLTIPPG